jgi:hypothetical protein
MIELIRELDYAGVKVLPIKYTDGRIYHIYEYNTKFDNGLSDDEHQEWIAKGFSNGIAVLMSKANPNLKCLDFDEKNAIGKNVFENWKYLIDPVIFSKLVIERTRSNGYHVYFLCNDKCDVHAIAYSEDGREVIGLRGDNFNGITYCAPTPKYQFIQGSLLELQSLDFDEMMQLIDCGYQFNAYKGNAITSSGGVKQRSIAKFPQPPIKYKQVMEIFDSKVDEMFIPNYLETIGWSLNNRRLGNGRDYGKFIELYRPGKSEDERTVRSASYYYDTKRLSVYTDSVGVKLPSINNGEGLASWLSPYQVLFYLNDRNWDETSRVVVDLCGQMAIELPERVPMVSSVANRNGLTWRLEIRGIQLWAIESGFMMMKMSIDDDAPSRLIRVVENVIYDIDESDIQRAFVDFVMVEYTEADAQRLLIAFLPRLMSYLTILPQFDGNILRDGSDCSYLLFNNGVLKVTSTEVELIKYNELDQYVFVRDIKPFDYKSNNDAGVFVQFINILSIDEQHKKFLMSAFGYILHNYKRKSFAKAVMIIEDVDDQEEARGRSGKGLLGQFIKWIRQTIEQDGRNYKTDSQFKMQRISPWTQVFYLNDPQKGLPIQQFYNYITDDFLIENKGKKSYTIPFNKSPKVFITTNFLPSLESDSDKDRFIVVPIKKVFSSVYRLKDAFNGQDFFSDDWDYYEKMSAINFAIDCIQVYLKEGVIEYENAKMNDNKAKRLLQDQVPEFIIEVLEQAIQTYKIAKNHVEFEEMMQPFDQLAQDKDSLLYCFEWESGGLNVYNSHLLRYCIKAFKVKILDKYFSRKVKTYCDINQLEVTQKRSVKQGRYIFINNLDSHQKNNSLAIDGISLAIDGSFGQTKYKPIIENDDMF